MDMSPVHSLSVSSEDENSGGQPVTEVWGLGWRWAVRPLGPLAPLSTKTSLAKWHRTNPTLFGPQFPLPSLKGKEYSFFLLIQHCQPWKVELFFSWVTCAKLQELTAKRGNGGERGGEGQKEQFFGIHPPVPAFLSSTPMFLVWWVLRTTHNALHWRRLGRGGVWAHKLLLLLFFACFLNKKTKKQKECGFIFLVLVSNFFFARVGKREMWNHLFSTSPPPRSPTGSNPDVFGNTDKKGRLKAWL